MAHRKVVRLAVVLVEKRAAWKADMLAALTDLSGYLSADQMVVALVAMTADPWVDCLV